MLSQRIAYLYGKVTQKPVPKKTLILNRHERLPCRPQLWWWCKLGGPNGCREKTYFGGRCPEPWRLMLPSCDAMLNAVGTRSKGWLWLLLPHLNLVRYRVSCMGINVWIIYKFQIWTLGSRGRLSCVWCRVDLHWD